MTRQLPIDQVALFNVRSRKRLARVLGVKPSELNALTSDELYRVCKKRDEKGKLRDIQEPCGILRRVHDRIQYLLSQIETPEYLQSGKKGISPCDNARRHASGAYRLKMDVRNFFPSCTQRAVYQFYKITLRMEHDIALLFSLISTYGGFIPTGSPLSMSLAFWAYRPTFERIAAVAQAHGITPTLYVDDLVFSASTKIPKRFSIQVAGHLKRTGLAHHPAKTKWAGCNRKRIVTGAVTTGDGHLLVPNRIRHRIIQLARLETSVEHLDQHQARSLIGSIRAARQIEPRFFEGTYRRLRARERADACNELTQFGKGVQIAPKAFAASSSHPDDAKTQA